MSPERRLDVQTQQGSVPQLRKREKIEKKKIIPRSAPGKGDGYTDKYFSSLTSRKLSEPYYSVILSNKTDATANTGQ